MSEMETKEFRHIRLKPADNGYILEYDEVKEAKVSSEKTYCDRDYQNREVVFGDSDEELDKAMAKMKELYVFNKTKKGGVSTPPSFSDKVEMS